MPYKSKHYTTVEKLDCFGMLMYSKDFEFAFDAEDKYIDLVREHYVRGHEYTSDILHRPLEETVTFDDGIIITIRHK